MPAFCEPANLESRNSRSAGQSQNPRLTPSLYYPHAGYPLPRLPTRPMLSVTQHGEPRTQHALADVRPTAVSWVITH